MALAAALATPAGPITAIPLLMFAAGVRRIPLSTLGLLQNVTSMLQLLIGICIYGGPSARCDVFGQSLDLHQRMSTWRHVQ